MGMVAERAGIGAQTPTPSAEEGETKPTSGVQAEQRPQVALEPGGVAAQLPLGDPDRPPAGEQQATVAEAIVLEGVAGRVGVGVVELGDDRQAQSAS